jgi:hypothetical protein
VYLYSSKPPSLISGGTDLMLRGISSVGAAASDSCLDGTTRISDLVLPWFVILDPSREVSVGLSAGAID